ncbi:MAG: DNA translocase FtsK [Gemmatimonadota bacterium]|nr:DNA translocase FtsK [Gemmatimonadota bacterium]
MRKEPNEVTVEPQDRPDLINQVCGVFLFAVALFLAVSLVSHSPQDPPNSGRAPELTENMAGWIGSQVSYYLLFSVGHGAYVLAAIVLMWGWNRFRERPALPLASQSLALLALAVVYSAASCVPSRGETQLSFLMGGWLGVTLAGRILVPYLGFVGSYILLCASFVVFSMVLTRTSFSRIPELWASRARRNPAPVSGGPTPGLPEQPQTVEERVPAYTGTDLPGNAPESGNHTASVLPAEPEDGVPEPVPPCEDDADEPEDPPSVLLDPDIVADPVEISRSTGLKPKARAPGDEDVQYRLPDLELLNEPAQKEEGPDRSVLLEGAQTLEHSLSSFGIEGKVVQVNPGPVITGYEVQPPRGVKVNRIVNLSDDLALVMKARSIRIQAPIPGKAAVGIEVPNANPSIVFLREILESDAFQDADEKLMLALGKSATGESVCTSLASMPHLLIAGATGSGKSVCVNGLITSILMRCGPEEVRFIMVDPKMLELSIYNSIPHLLAPVVTEPQKASEALRWAVAEMEDRYRNLAQYNVRNITDFNDKLEKMRTEAESEEDRTEVPPLLPYIVVVVDELADLMMTAPADIEDSLTRLAQMARAVGIHLILATQRPSVNVITGTIKANFPSRIAFRVASKVDSRTILDCNGAEKLLGRGDMLFMPAGKPEPVRVHGANMTTEETERLVEWVSGQGVEMEQLDLGVDENELMLAEGSRDKRFDEALRLVVTHQQGSASLLQRRMKVGYARAARLVDELEQAGIVGPSDGSSKGREVLVGVEYLDRHGEEEPDAL